MEAQIYQFVEIEIEVVGRDEVAVRGSEEVNDQQGDQGDYYKI